MNGYIAFYRGKQKEVYAETSREAQLGAMAHFQIGVRRQIKPWNVSITLAEKDGQQVLQSTCL